MECFQSSPSRVPPFGISGTFDVWHLRWLSHRNSWELGRRLILSFPSIWTCIAKKSCTNLDMHVENHPSVLRLCSPLFWHRKRCVLFAIALTQRKKAVSAVPDAPRMGLFVMPLPRAWRILRPKSCGVVRNQDFHECSPLWSIVAYKYMCIIYIYILILILLLLSLLLLSLLLFYIYIWGTVKMVEDHFSIAGVFCERYARNTVKR